MKSATIFQIDTPGWVEVVTPYDQDYLDDMKILIAYENRIWVPETKSWRIRISELSSLKRLLMEHGFSVSEEKLPETPISGNMFTYLFNIIPDEYVNTVYHALAQALHPDHGGTNKQMQQINAAYEARAKKGG